jgi:hypothetical protein
MKERTIVKFSGASLKEALQSVLPIFAIVLLLSVSVAPMQSGILVTFLFGTLLLILGMNFFTIGSGISMQPLGEGIGIQIKKSKNLPIPLLICIVLGVLIAVKGVFALIDVIKKSRKNALEIVFPVLTIVLGALLAFGNGVGIIIAIAGVLLAIDGVIGLIGSLKK